jgi:hypothetical protein
MIDLLKLKVEMGQEKRKEFRDNFCEFSFNHCDRVNYTGKNDDGLEWFIENTISSSIDRAAELCGRERDKTTITNQGKDECYCEWYQCDKCKSTMITNESNYCPECGSEIIK